MPRLVASRLAVPAGMMPTGTFAPPLTSRQGVQGALHHAVAAPHDQQVDVLPQGLADLLGRLPALRHLEPEQLVDALVGEPACAARRARRRGSYAVGHHGDLPGGTHGRRTTRSAPKRISALLPAPEDALGGVGALAQDPGAAVGAASLLHHIAELAHAGDGERDHDGGDDEAADHVDDEWHAKDIPSSGLTHRFPHALLGGRAADHHQAQLQLVGRHRRQVLQRLELARRSPPAGGCRSR